MRGPDGMPSESVAAAAPPGQPRLPRWAWYGLSALASLLVAAVFAHPWDTFVFQRTVEDLLLRGLTPYQVAEAAPAYTYWGGALPALPLWYAYPPVPLALMAASYFPAAFDWLPWAWPGRVLIRLPFILATLGLAALARRVVATAPGANAATLRKADWLERAILANPLFLVIGSLWGQFEALILVLLFLTVVALRKSQFGRAGAWWALAVCVKIFPLYLVPLLALHIHRTGGRKGVARFAAASLAVGTLINLPFLLWSPTGYLQQVFFMHGARAPARLAPLAYIGKFLAFVSRNLPDGIPSPDNWAPWLGVISLVLVLAVLTAIAAASLRAPATEGHLLQWMALTLLGGLLATKVLNEQYLLLPLGLFLVARVHPQRTLSPGLGRFTRWLSWSVVAAGLVAGFNLLYALPASTSLRLFDALAPELVGRVAFAMHLTVSQLRHVLSWSTGLALLVPAVQAIRLLKSPLRAGLIHLERGLLSRLRRLQHGSRPIVLASLIVFLCALPLGLAVATSPSAGSRSQPLASGDGWVLAEVTTSWYNPSNDPDLPQGTWNGVAVQPDLGYYTLNAHKAQRDLAQISAAGFDGIIIAVHPFYEGYAATLRRVAEANGMPYALGIDLAALPGATVPLEAATAQQLRTAMERPTNDYWSGRQHIVTPDGQAHVVFLKGVAKVQPEFTPAEIAFVLDAWSRAGASAADAATLAATPPQGARDLLGDDVLAVHWRAAYTVAELAWWTQAVGIDHVALVTDAPLPLGAAAWLGSSKATGAPLGPGLRFATLAGVLAPDSARAGWARIERADPDGVIVPWNDFAHGQAVEPTRQFADATLAILQDAIARFKQPEFSSQSPKHFLAVPGTAVGRGDDAGSGSVAGSGAAVRFD